MYDVLLPVERLGCCCEKVLELSQCVVWCGVCFVGEDFFFLKRDNAVDEFADYAKIVGGRRCNSRRPVQ